MVMPPPRQGRVIGDRGQRVTVPLPQNTNDLEKLAKDRFGKGPYKVTCYHNGEKLLDDPRQWKDIHEQDVVIVRRESTDSGPKMNATTTMQSAYVKHPIERAQPRPATPPSKYGLKSPTFQGRSTYVGDYIEHPMESPGRSKKPEPAWEATNIPMTSRSTYTENFPWHKSPPKKRSSGPKQSDGAGRAPPPFNGQSSYKMDYVKHANERPKSAQGQRRGDPRVEQIVVPFNGSTTYNQDYKKHAHEQTERVGPSTWKQDPAPSPPFRGNSEYQNQYIKKQRERDALVHLEPEEGGPIHRSRSARG